MKYLVLLLISISTFAQTNNPLEQTLEKYSDYFENERESLYLHLNKSTYLRGEYLWFQGYSYNRQNQNLNLNTRNVELKVYNNSGKLKEKQLLLSNGGIFSGQVKIDSSFTDGTYYLVAETHWMKNFKEDYRHIQKFEVLETVIENRVSTSKSYDIKLLPEGGHLVRDMDGRLGVKIIDDSGLGVKYRGVLFENDKKILDFESNQFGHAVLDILPKKDLNYRVKFNLPKGVVLEEQINDIKDHGIVLLVNNILEDKIIVNIDSNLKEDFYNNSNLQLLVHKEGNTLSIPIELSPDKKSSSKMIDKELLFYGVNTITLLQNGNPVLERLVFNDINSIKETEDISLEQVNGKQKDSIHFKLNFKEALGNKNISVSVLPSKSVSYRKNKNIISSLLLELFVNGYIEDAGYYFSGSEKRKRSYNLDLLLLTQGWSKYNWDNILTESPEIQYERRNGLTQVIEIENKIPKRVNALMVNNITQDNIRLFDLNSNNKIVIENTYPFKDNKLSFSFIKENNKLRKPDVTFSTDYPLEEDNSEFEDFMPSIADERRIKNEINKEQVYFNFKSEFQLDEVKLYGEAKEFSELKYNTGLFTFFKDKVKIDKELAERYIFLSQYLNAHGYLVYDNGNEFNIRERRANTEVWILYDGNILSDFSILSRTYTADYEMIGFNRLGLQFSRPGSYIYLEPRKTPLYDKDLIHQFQIDVINGFEVNKEYYMPKYASFRTESFQQFGTIAWFSNLKLNENEVADLKIFNTGLEDVTFYIEGIAEDGSLIHIQKTVEVR